MELKINKQLKTPAYKQIQSQIKTMIIKGDLVDGYALPSERALARELNVHRNTVVKSYNELKADGIITSYQGVGYRVSYSGSKEKSKERHVNWIHAIKEEYLDWESAFDDLFTKSYGEKEISFAGGMASRQVYGQQDIADGLAEIFLSANRGRDFYTPYQGDLELRKEVALFMRTKGVITNQSQIQIFSENNQALDFLVTILLSAGDCVFTEESVSPDVYRAIELAGARIITIPMDKDGMICDNLEGLIERHKPKFIYVNSSYHNPTGVLLSLERRKILLELSYRYRVPIIEEDEASELYYEEKKVPSIKSMDKGRNVIYMNSFSLTLVPGVGVSFVIAPKPIIKSLRYLVSVRLITLDWTPQRLACRYLKTGVFSEKLAAFRKEYKEKRDLMCAYLDRASETIDLTYKKPQGGVFLWVKLPDDIDVPTLVREAELRRVAFIPGHIFFPDRNPDGNYIRLNYSYPTLDEIKTGMTILTESMQKIQK